MVTNLWVFTKYVEFLDMVKYYKHLMWLYWFK